MPPAIESPLSKECPLTDDERRAVEKNEKLVCAIASRNFKNSRLSVKDRVQAGTLGLMKAVRKFDPTRGVAFSTYATYWIKNAIRQAEMKDEVVHVPLWVRHEHSDAVLQARADRFHRFRDQAFQVGCVFEDGVAEGVSSESPIDDADEASWLMRKFESLTAKQKEILAAVFWDGEDYKKIARRFGVSRACVHLWRQRALATLKEAYDAEYAKGA